MSAESVPPGNAEAGLEARLRHALLDIARARQVVTYRDLAALAQVPKPHSIYKLTLALEAMIRDDQAAGRPLLAALAVSRGLGSIPGRGFFRLLAELGRYTGPDRGPAAAAAHAGERDRAWGYWRGHDQASGWFMAAAPAARTGFGRDRRDSAVPGAARRISRNP